MKRIYMIGIVVVLVILAGAYLFSPISPLNKASVNGETVRLPTGFTVNNSSEHSLVISNGTTEFKIVSITYTKDLKTAIDMYKERFEQDYNITEKKMKTPGGTGVTKDVAKLKNQTAIRYWFTKNGKPYYIRTENTHNKTQDIIFETIDSM